MVLVPLPYGEIVDRIVILELKCSRITDRDRRGQARHLMEELVARWVAAKLPAVASLNEYPELVAVNTALWEVEDALRTHERAGTFGESFVALAREVYRQNDRRAALKQAIDVRLGSPLSEPKSYPLDAALQSGT